MGRRVVIIGFALLVLIAAGIVVTYIPKARMQANFKTSQNNLRELALFAAHHHNPEADLKRDPSKFPTQIPSGTVPLTDAPPDNGPSWYLAAAKAWPTLVPLAEVPVENRLSWAVGILPGLDQKKQNTEELLARLDRTKPWTAEPNQQVGRTRLVTMLCPEKPPEAPADGPGVTSYVGIGGLGANAATLPPGSPKAGAFRYDGPTSFAHVTDGLGQSLLFGETRHEVGPWLRGGPATVRGLDDAPGAPPLISEQGGAQFGGYFPSGANFALCDGGVRTFSPRTTPAVLLGLATIAGKGHDPMPGE